MSVDDDIDLILADGDDTVTIGEDQVTTMLMVGDAVQGETQQAGGVIIGSGYVLLRASQFPDLTADGLLTVNGQNYRASQVMRIQDGRVLQVWLGAPDGQNSEGDDE